MAKHRTLYLKRPVSAPAEVRAERAASLACSNPEPTITGPLRGSRKRLPAMTTIHQPMNVLALAVALVAGLLAASAARAADETPFTEMAEHYEVIWRSLAGDTIDGVAEHALAIAEIAEESDHPAAAQDALPEIAEHARALTQKASAGDIEAAREAFGDLTKPLVRYRKAVGAERLKVAYCPMANKSWLQPEGEIGNPYYGSEMLTCGSFIGS